MSEVQTFLRNGATLADLEAQYAVKAARHGKHPNLVQLKYSQVASPMHVPLVQECRGMILDEAEDWRLVARGFDKFFNYGEPGAAPLDWNTARVQEKVDGSLMMVYWYAGHWHVATTGRPDAGGECNGHGFSFADLFWNTLAHYPNAVFREVDSTYLFEMTTRYNRVVVRHTQESLTLLAIRHLASGFVPASFLRFKSEIMGIPQVKEYPLQRLEEVLSTFETMQPVEQEGYVIVDQHHQRIKVKHPGYVALHHMKNGLSPKTFLEAVRKGESSEVLAHFPELEPIFLPIQTAYTALLEEVQADYAELRHIETQKEFAVQALARRCSAALFQLRAGRATDAQDYFANAVLSSLMRLLGMKETPEEEQD